MKISFPASFLGFGALLLSVPGGASANDQANDFPTLARVEYVLQCMMELGGENYDHLYGCSCRADKVAGALSYEEYNEATTFTYLKRTPGERGGLFRDPPRSRELVEKLAQAKAHAEKSCLIIKRH